MKGVIIQSYGEAVTTERSELEFREDDGTEEKVINIYPEMKDQQLDGFGGAITDAAGSVFAEMELPQQEELLRTYFTKEGLNYSLVRIPMDSCDFAINRYEAMSSSDPTWESFDFTRTQQYILPLLNRAEKMAGRKLKILLSAWSPPKFMKTNGKRTHGGSLKKEYQAMWAEYLCHYIKKFRDAEYEVARMTIQNEPNALQEWDSCLYSGEEEKIFLKDYLYPALVRYGYEDIEIFIWDHNKERLFDRAKQVIEESTEHMICGAAFHWYSGDHFEALDLFRRKFPNKKLILSESCLEFSKYGKGEESANAGRLAHDMIGNLNHGLSSFYDWNILLDQNGGPNYVHNYCDAPYLYHKDTKKLEKRRILQYYWHFAHFLLDGAVQIGHTTYTKELEVTAFENPNGDIILILLNETDQNRSCVLRLQGKMANVEVKQNGISTIVVKQ